MSVEAFHPHFDRYNKPDSIEVYERMQAAGPVDLKMLHLIHTLMRVERAFLRDVGRYYAGREATLDNKIAAQSVTNSRERYMNLAPRYGHAGPAFIGVPYTGKFPEEEFFSWAGKRAKTIWTRITRH